MQRVHASCYDVLGTGYLTPMQLLAFVQHLLLRLTDVAEVEQSLPLDAYAVLASARLSLSLSKAGRCAACCKAAQNTYTFVPQTKNLTAGTVACMPYIHIYMCLFCGSQLAVLSSHDLPQHIPHAHNRPVTAQARNAGTGLCHTCTCLPRGIASSICSRLTTKAPRI